MDQVVGHVPRYDVVIYTWCSPVVHPRPLLFLLFTVNIAFIANGQSISVHSYADDTQST